MTYFWCYNINLKFVALGFIRNEFKGTVYQ